MSISAEAIEAAHCRIAPYLHRTPLLTSRALEERTGVQWIFKAENLQKVGAFKARGALNAALQVPDPSAGLATHSSGNHAQALAYAARVREVPAYIVMPQNAPRVKVEAVREYGGEITFCEPTQEAREEALAQVLARTGAAFIHPYDNDDVIAGQATCAKELLEDAGAPLDAIYVPVGGGGLFSGTCLACHYFSPGTGSHAGEPEGAGDAVLSLRTGRVETAPYVDTIADGLLTRLSPRTLAILRDHADGITLVTEAQIVEAVRWCFERLKLVVEPSGAVPLAAALADAERWRGRRVGVVLCGGNVDLSRLGEWFGNDPATTPDASITRSYT